MSQLKANFLKNKIDFFKFIRLAQVMSSDIGRKDDQESISGGLVECCAGYNRGWAVSPSGGSGDSHLALNISPGQVLHT